MAIIARGRAKHSLAQNFARFLDNVRPPKKRREAAKKYPNIVRTFLERTALLRTTEPHSHLTGSYRRRIAIHEIKDVDFVVYVDAIYAELGALAALNDLKSALDAFADELKKESGETIEVELREQRRSVRVRFVAEDFFLDVVPVRAAVGTEGLLLVPDREWKSWQPTACVAYCERFSELNQECDDLLVPVMKTIKHWRSKWLKRDQAKSFWLEAMIVDLIRRKRIEFAERSLAEVVADALLAIRDECGRYRDLDGATPIVPDPVIPDLNPNVAFNWEREHFLTFMRRIDEACVRVERALAADTAADAIRGWQAVLGEEWFPASVDDYAETAKTAAAEALASGKGLPVGSTGRVFIGSLPAAGNVVTSRPHLNHGDEDDI